MLLRQRPHAPVLGVEREREREREESTVSVASPSDLAGARARGFAFDVLLVLRRLGIIEMHGQIEQCWELRKRWKK